MKLLAALQFFTRIPIYKWIDLPQDDFKNVVSYWSLCGWVTASCTAGILWISAQILPYPVAILLAFISRLFLTGAFHEDGLADFFDGFGGGHQKDQILTIMKDSHIGSYGVISLIFYFLILFTLFLSLPLNLACILILCVDPAAKAFAAMIINRLPYVRKLEDSKCKIIYNPMSIQDYIISFVIGLLPLFILTRMICWLALLPLILFFFVFTRFLKKKIGGYTGDCCGAFFLLNEILLLMFLVMISLWN